MASIGHNQRTMNANSLTIEQKKQLKNAVIELNDSMTRVAAERDLQKEAIDNISEKLGLDKKLVRRLATVYFRANYNDEIEQHNTFEEFYTTVISPAAGANRSTTTPRQGVVSSIPIVDSIDTISEEDLNILRTDGWSNK